MNTSRKIIVDTLTAIAFTFLFLLPVLGFMTTTTSADETAQGSISDSQGYVFFVVQDNETPLAAAPSTDISSYILWIGLISFGIVLIFMYTAWYYSIRRNIRELSERMSPMERKAFYIPQGFLHPVRSYHLAQEAEDMVASIYTGYI